METVTCNVRDLPQSDRSALERVVGHPLRESEQVVIQVMSPPTAETAAVPPVSGELPDWCNIYQGLSDLQIDELDQAITRSDSSRDFS